MTRSDLDRALGLPAGAAHRRRLFVVAVNVDRVPGTAIRRGDRLVVEPGSHSTVDRLVVVRERGAPGLRRVRLDGQGETVLGATDPEALPFPQEVARRDVLGTVIAVLPARWLDEPSRAAAPTSPNVKLTATGTLDDDVRLRRANRARAELNLTTLARWLEHHGDDRRLGALASRLKTLHGCMTVVSNGNLYEALVGEINRVIARAARGTGPSSAPRLRPLPYRGPSALEPRPNPRRAASGTQSRPEAAERTRQLPLLLDRPRCCRRGQQRGPRKAPLTHSAIADSVDRGEAGVV